MKSLPLFVQKSQADRKKKLDAPKFHSGGIKCKYYVKKRDQRSIALIQKFIKICCTNLGVFYKFIVFQNIP